MAVSGVMSGSLLEVIALGAEDAVAARAGGADRLELVTGMAADGLTPSRETFAAVRAAVALPVRVMLRAGEGFLAGGAEAVDALCARARRLRDEGADEFVLGFLDEAGNLDAAATEAVCGAVRGCRWTFHRALDHAADRDGLRRRLAELSVPGPDTVLTAGAARGVGDGLDVLRAESARSAAGEPGYAPRVMAGGGLRPEHLPDLRAAGVDAFHIGGAARSGGWTTPVDAGRVRAWRELLG